MRSVPGRWCKTPDLRRAGAADPGCRAARLPSRADALRVATVLARPGVLRTPERIDKGGRRLRTWARPGACRRESALWNRPEGSYPDLRTAARVIAIEELGHAVGI